METQNKLKEIRKTTGLSQVKFAKEFEIPHQTYEQWEFGRRTPPEYIVKMIEELVKYKGLDKNVSR